MKVLLAQLMEPDNDFRQPEFVKKLENVINTKEKQSIVLNTGVTAIYYNDCSRIYFYSDNSIAYIDEYEIRHDFNLAD